MLVPGFITKVGSLEDMLCVLDIISFVNRFFIGLLMEVFHLLVPGGAVVVIAY